MDRIVLEGIRASGRHGALDHERGRPQEFEIDIACAANARAASRTDELDTTIDYRRLRQVALEVVGRRSYKLVETIAERIADAVLDELHPRWVQVRVTKLEPEGLGVPASVEVERWDDERERDLRSAPVELHVPDFAPAKAFYGALGLSVVREDAGPDGYLVMASGTDVLRFWPGNAGLRAHTYFQRFPASTPRGYGVEIVLTFADLDAAHERAAALGAVVEPLRVRHWGLRDFRVSDPYGFYVRCTEPHDVVSGARRRRSSPDHPSGGTDHDEARPRDQRGERRRDP